jgi:hypothetical protein
VVLPHNHEELIAKLIAFSEAGQNIILIGLHFALLDLIEKAVSIATYHNHGNIER